MRSYIFDDSPDSGDQRQPHDSGRAVPLSRLQQLGVLPHPNIDLAKVDAIAEERGYACRDEINVSRAGLGDAYEAKIKTFFAEHLHEDEEIRYILDGSGYFDVREVGDKEWIRIKVEKDDLIVLPAGVYHRFTLDDTDYIKAMRLFQQAPKWTPINRGEEADNVESRKQYLASLPAAITA